MSIQDDMVAIGVDWRSLRTGLSFIRGTADPGGGGEPEPEPPPPPPVESGEYFLYTSAEVTKFRTRMSGAGPYYAQGDAGHGGQYSPADGLRCISNSNSFLSNPTATYFQAPVPFATLNARPGSSHGNLVGAAWCYMTQPNRSDRNTLRDALKAYLMWTATRSNHDFANSTNWPISYSNSAPRPMFDYGGWMCRNLKIRDMLTRDVFTAAENTTLDKWFYTWANFIFRWYHATCMGVSSYIPNRLDRDYATGGSNSFIANSQPYDGGPSGISALACYRGTNRHFHAVESASMIANYLKYFGSVPSTSGTQPAYGWYTVDEMLHHSRVAVEEWIYTNLHPQGFMGDQHRVNDNDGPFRGFYYTNNQLMPAMEMAHWHARRGDMNLFNYATTSGRGGSAGSPNDTSGVSGFPSKNLHYASWAHSRYANDAWGRRRNGQSLTKPVRYRDIFPAVLMTRYVTDAYLTSAWRRDGNSFPAYPNTQNFNDGDGQAEWTGFSTMHVKSAGLIEFAP